jgi:arylsulfatase A-like enzyme
MNVILILLDTLRRDHLGCYGNPWIRTPHFDRLAAMSCVFENAYLGSYPCMPARRDMFTGRYEFPWRGWGPLEADEPNVVARARAAGRTTALITDHYHLFEHGAGNYHFDFDGWEFVRGQENDHWITDPTIAVRFPAPERTKCHFRWSQYYRNTAAWRDGDGAWRGEEHTFAAQTFQTAAAWLERNHTLPGYFLLIDCFDPHEPFDPPHPYDTLYAPNPPEARVRWPIYGSADRYTDEEICDIRALYAGEVTLTDRWFGSFLDTAERVGALQDTAILLTTDHGHLFGEHGMIGKPSTTHGDSSLYQPLSHVPLILSTPETRRSGCRRRQLVQPVDLYPTILELLGVDEAEGRGVRAFGRSGVQAGGDLAAGIHGVSLVPMLADEGARTREVAVYAKWGEAMQITDGRYTLHQWPPSREQNEPLFWYSPHPPEFLKPRGLGPWDGAHRRFGPVDYVRGDQQSALYDLADDYGQEQNRIAELPGEAARLRRGLRDFLVGLEAPAEQAERLGL